MLRTLCLLALLALLGHGAHLAQDAPAPKPESIAPGKVPPAFKKLYPQLHLRKLYTGAVQYTAETVKALKEAEVKPARWNDKRTAFFNALAANVNFRGFPGESGERELKPAECGNEFIVITVPEGKLEAQAIGDLAKSHGLKLLEFIESSAASGLRAIDPGFSEEAIRAFWVNGREVKWTLLPTPEIYTYSANGVDKTEKRQWTGNCTTKCSEVTDAGFKLASSYKLTFSNSNRSSSSTSSSGSARLYNMIAMQLTQTPLRGQYVSMQWLECLSKREDVKLKLGEKEYACARFITRPRYLDASETSYETSEFYFCAEVPGVPFKVERALVTPAGTQTWSQEFDSTTAPE